MGIRDEKIWLGTEQSLKASLDACDLAAERIKAGFIDEEDDEDDEDCPRLLDIQGNVAVISIKGPLNNEDDDWNRWFGMCGYPEIREALLAAAADESVTDILLDIDSGGGAVSGCDDTAKLIRLISDKVKPVTAYGENMFSAAYWLGCSASKVYAGKVSGVGSIGCLTTHMERSRMLEEAGIGVNVIRSGKYKALVNSVEPLSEEGRKQLQAAVDAVDAIFVEHVAAMRGYSAEVVRRDMGEGREFIGKDALTYGLIDAISTFDEVFASLANDSHSLDDDDKFVQTHAKQGSGVRFTGETQGGTTMAGRRKPLTPQDIAALAAGAPIEVTDDSGTTQEVREETQAAAAQAAEPQAASQGEGDGVQARQETQEVSAQASAESEKFANLKATVELLNAQVAAKDAALLEAGVKISRLEERVEDMKATAEPLLDIAAQSVNNMRVALGLGALDMKAMGGAQVLAEHQRMSAEFASKFKVGGVAAVAHVDTKGAAKADPIHLARVNAARFHK